MIIENIRALVVSGKEPHLSFEGDDMILEIKSKKQEEAMKVEKDGIIKVVGENILADYISAGWKIHKEPKQEIKPKKTENKEKIDD